MLNTYSTAMAAPTIARALGVGAPRRSDAENTLRPVDEMVDSYCGKGKIDKLLLFNPDAVALWLYQKYTDLFLPVIRNTRMMLPMRTVMPSVTPVCFGTIYTGAMPEVHGIRKYEKPVIKIDTLFDRLIEAGRRPVIVANDECSMGKIFLGRDMDYIIQPLEKHLGTMIDLIDEDAHDVYVVYEGNYDGTMHRDGVEAETSLAALDSNARHFDALVSHARKKWDAEGKKSMYAWITDHGCHNDEIGRGTHGSDMEEDMNIAHFWGVGN